MRHGRASELLADFAGGALEPAVRGELTVHVESCEECREWLATYRLLAATLAEGGPAAAGEHPTGDLLALYALRPQEVGEAARAELFQHVGDCADCRRETEVARAAVLRARPEEEAAAPAPGPSVRPVRRHRAWRLALAAGLATALIGTALILRTYVPAPAPAEAEAEATLISDTELQGRQVIEAEGALVATTVNLESGAQITLRAGDVVALGDGFAVGNGADLTIETANQTIMQ